ncbi:hypothetical protein FH972_026921 [Carpinus fangiana]|uniref:DUF221-domain-containing protein n=1 Tax=Carpinus fangiana TaxID=176857 RepID=A0A5N6L5T4_9ROSI|nr:hypothetical protein FH972_026921 [Carpinus fangiana]
MSETSTTTPSSDTGNEFLDLISDPFSSEVQQTSFYASLGYSLLITGLLFLLFCWFRPRNRAVYAPRAKHADDRHAPPTIGRGLFTWFGPVRTAKDFDMVEKIGMDAVIFLRFLRMLRNIFLVLSPVGLAVLIPTNLIGQHDTNSYGKISWLTKLTPQYISGSRFWVFSILCYVFDAIVLYFIWQNYRAVLKLRRLYFNSTEYQASLHSRTLLVTQVPKEHRTDEGLSLLAESAKPTDEGRPRAAIARNVKDLPALIEEHEEAVEKLEGYLAKYLARPDHPLPTKRPLCKPFKKDKARTSEHKVDAIEYLTLRIKELEREIKEVRQTLDQRNPMPYGFASYSRIEDAHAVAFATKNKGPQATRIRLAPKTNDLIWNNLHVTEKERRNKGFWAGLVMTLLTIAYIIPNILIAVFLSNLGHLAQVWKGFQGTFQAHSTWWAIAQGIIAPGIQTLFYLFLPSIFRRLFHKSGDHTKSSRERHVTARLYAFFVFNNLIVFSVFSTIWTFVAALIDAGRQNSNTWDTIQNQHVFVKLTLGLCNVAPYWITWQTQRLLGAAIDLAQVWPLIWGSFMRHTTNPTPRQNIRLTAPQPFLYADYYNNYLFVSTVGLCFATIHPFILPITAFYITVEGWFKTYLLQYVVITRVESGGLFWRMLINRLLFGMLLANAVTALVIGAKGVGDYNYGIAQIAKSAGMLYVLIPIPFIVWAFKWYCQRTFDVKIAYYSIKSIADPESVPTDPIEVREARQMKRNADRVGVKFGHPALYKKLMTPMVSAKAQHLLKQVYGGRTHGSADDLDDAATVGGYSDVFMTNMSASKIGKHAKTSSDPHFEFVADGDTDFENFKRRAEFREEFGGEGELYGRPDDTSRPGTPGSRMSMMSMGTTAVLGDLRSRSHSPHTRDSSQTRTGGEDDGTGVVYPKGYIAADAHQEHRFNRLDSRQGSVDIATSSYPTFRGGSPHSYYRGSEEEGQLMGHASGMGQATPLGYEQTTRGRTGPVDYFTAPLDDEDTSYDAFRRRGDNARRF